ncbi:hypothetical protein Q0Z83_025980 [Actinoplanes sichuanensis]|uniref:Septum formation-related domain-containing protein n=1 Tax=Actinoplanes sichuanensis TaxID=512349 RepID=A0ABW4AUM6_9ACTN|nr:hypothetical protein [Actinoplanes sichuanensis]BEL04407.1 hypothetical protein Q0Z83_025980 [Actinoplanes sichuanensis]
MDRREAEKARKEEERRLQEEKRKREERRAMIILASMAVVGMIIAGIGALFEDDKPAEPATAATAAAALADTPVEATSPTPSAAVTTTPPPPKHGIDLICSSDAEQTTTTTFTVPADSKGRYDFREVWKAEQYDCDLAAVNGTPQVEMTPTTSLQKKAMKAAEYTEPDISSLFDLCAQASPADVYLSNTFTMSEAQATELTGALMLCPSHPFADEWRKAIKKSEQESGSDSGDGEETVKGVHPGAFCTPEGARGYTSAGTLMKCSYKSGDNRARWRRA